MIPAIRVGYTDQNFHKDFDEEKRKRFGMLIKTKVRHFCAGDPRKSYHVRVDPLPSRYEKADEAAFKITSNALKKELGLEPIKSLVTHHSHQSPGIQVADVLLGATLSDWHDDATADAKLVLRLAIAEHLGWPDLRADTSPSDWKFNLWYFYDPVRDPKREVKTRPVKLKIPMPSYPKRKA